MDFPETIRPNPATLFLTITKISDAEELAAFCRRNRISKISLSEYSTDIEFFAPEPTAQTAPAPVVHDDPPLEREPQTEAIMKAFKKLPGVYNDAGLWGEE